MSAPVTTPTERTPLTSILSSPPGPSYVFPGVSPRSRRRQMRQFQCCICSIFITIAVLAVIVGLSYSNIQDSPVPLPPDSLAISTDEIPILNSTQLFNFLIELKHPLDDEKPSKWTLPTPNPEESKNAENVGIKALGDKEIFEENLTPIPVDSPVFRHYRAISSTPEGRMLSKKGYVEYHATFDLANKYNYTKIQGRNNIGRGPMISSADRSLIVRCNFNSRYRTQNGICNNKRYPRTFGASMIPFRRALAPDYSDGINQPRMSHSGKELPSARQVSLGIHRPVYSSDPKFTVMLAVYGQFLDHDITATALNSAQEGLPIDCCSPGLAKHPECFPVPLVSGDPYHDKYNLTCMNFVRSAPAPTGRFGPREQLNQATAFIDGSVIYGNSESKMNMLRAKNNGKLRMYKTPDNRQLLPISTDMNDGCNRVEMNAVGKYCFDSGDDRANENLHLTSMHLIFARQHNYLAKNLQDLNPEWNDEMVFQESRKILGAQLQHITYNEFLPVLLGEDFAMSKGITSDPTSSLDTYDQNVNPSVANNFASSVFRFAHTLLPGLFRLTSDNTTKEQVELHRMLFNPFSLWSENGVDRAIDSAVNTPVMKVNQYFSKELSEKLFQEDAVANSSTTSSSQKPKIPLCGLDLVSLNIQRGRDHGLPSYTEWRKHCKLPSANTWDDMANIIDPESLEIMKTIYEIPQDVDLYTGALSEPPIDGAIFGPLLACLISDQFIRVKMGDSHWYERKIGPQKFSKEQLNEIYKTSLAGIICQNSDNVQSTQKYVMQRVDNSTNPYVNCSGIKHFDFTPWSNDNVVAKNFKVQISHPQSFISVMTSPNKTTPKNILV